MSGQGAVCKHLDQIREVTPSSYEGCSECLATGGRWLHLRMCLSCGKVGCCDSSPNRHASRHALSSGHPLASSFEPGEDWTYCYRDQVAFTLEGIAHPHHLPYAGHAGGPG